MGGGVSKYGVTYGSKKYKSLKAVTKKTARPDLDQNSGSSGRFYDFGSHYEALKKSTAFFSQHSSSDTWHTQDITPEERGAIQDYTGSAYEPINKALYTQKYEDMTSYAQHHVDAMTAGIDKFVLTKGIQVTRQCDFKIFGAASGEKMSVAQIKDFIKKNAGADGTLENKGFLSFGANNHGAAIDGSGLVIHAKVPPSIGAGAYVNPISHLSGAAENEFLFNAYSRFKFDLSSIRKDSSGKIHINAVWKRRGRYK